MIYLLTASGFTPGGSCTLHIYTQTIHRTTQNKQYIEQHKIWEQYKNYGTLLKCQTRDYLRYLNNLNIYKFYVVRSETPLLSSIYTMFALPYYVTALVYRLISDSRSPRNNPYFISPAFWEHVNEWRCCVTQLRRLPKHKKQVVVTHRRRYVFSLALYLCGICGGRSDVKFFSRRNSGFPAVIHRCSIPIIRFLWDVLPTWLSCRL